MLATASMQTYEVSYTSCPMDYRWYLLPGRSTRSSLPESFKGFVLRIQGGAIWEIQAGSGKAEGSLALGVGLILQQAPQSVRSRQFAQAFARWRQSLNQASRIVRGAHEALAVERRESSLTSEQIPRTTAAAEQAGMPERQDFQTVYENASYASTLPSDSETSQQTPIQAHSVVPAPNAVSAPHQSSEPVAATRTQESPSEMPDATLKHLKQYIAHETAASNQQPSDMPAPGQEVVKHESTPAEPTALEKSEDLVAESFHTELGGILFLINVLKALDLPRSIEQECSHDFGLGCWELLELLGRCLLSPSEDHLASDPLWDALALLDGRSPGTAPGTHFSPSTVYRNPKTWIASASLGISPSRLQIRLRGSHLESWHADGFPILSRQIAEPPSREAIRDEIQYYSTNYITCSLFNK
jgi:hypothetical protein